MIFNSIIWYLPVVTAICIERDKIKFSIQLFNDRNQLCYGQLGCRLMEETVENKYKSSYITPKISTKYTIHILKKDILTFWVY